MTIAAKSLSPPAKPAERLRRKPLSVATLRLGTKSPNPWDIYSPKNVSAASSLGHPSPEARAAKNETYRKRAPSFGRPDPKSLLLIRTQL